MGVGGGDYALSFGGAQTDQRYGGGKQEIVVGDRLYNLLAGGADSPEEVVADELTLGGGADSDEVFLDVGGDEVFMDVGGGDRVTVGGSDRALEVGGGGGGGGGFGFGDSGLRGYRDDPGDLVGDFPLVSPYGAYTMEEMMAELDRIIGTAKNSEKNT
jgi:hypothetical protein